MNNNLFNLKNKNIVITGAAGLLGKNHAIAIAKAGGHLILLDLDYQSLRKLKKEIEKDFNSKIYIKKLDITKEVEVRNYSRFIYKKIKKIDGLINNAANNPKMENKNRSDFSRIENFKIDQWNKDISVGLTGSFLCAKYFGILISKNINGGSIINISSDLGKIAPDQRIYKLSKQNKSPVKPVSYSVVKSGIIGLTNYLATYWTNKNVRCNALCPGPIYNDQNKEFLNKLKRNIPLNRLAKPEEYQSSIVWMLSDSSSYLNGAIISVDGGKTTW